MRGRFPTFLPLMATISSPAYIRVCVCVCDVCLRVRACKPKCVCARVCAYRASAQYSLGLVHERLLVVSPSHTHTHTLSLFLSILSSSSPSLPLPLPVGISPLPSSLSLKHTHTHTHTLSLSLKAPECYCPPKSYLLGLLASRRRPAVSVFGFRD